jgi:DNA mismatch endonuclease (patch repair protein)
MDNLTPDQRRKNMSSIRSKGSKIEQIFAKALRDEGIRYQRNSQSIVGKPDFSIKKYKIAIFCDSEFWHGKYWQHEKNRITTNPEYWIKKIEHNIMRDQSVNKNLKADGWIVLRFWEKDIKSDVKKCIKKVKKNLDNRLRNQNI